MILFNKTYKRFLYLFWTFSASWGPILRRPAGRSTRLTVILGGFEIIKVCSYNSLCGCFKAHTILKSIRMCLCFEDCGGDSFPHIAKQITVIGCFFRRDFGESFLLKLRNFKKSIRICLCFEGCGGDSFHQIPKKSPANGCFFQLVFGDWALMMQRRFRKDKGIAYIF